jgi:hypothetical protein
VFSTIGLGDGSVLGTIIALPQETISKTNNITVFLKTDLKNIDIEIRIFYS